jgi:hypothetical protein
MVATGTFVTTGVFVTSAEPFGVAGEIKAEIIGEDTSEAGAVVPV